MSYFDGVQFRSTDVHGRSVDTSTETPTQRSERIERLQIARLAQGERGVPPSDPVSVFAEWCRNPENRQSRLAQLVAENPELLPQAELEPGPGQEPVRGGVIDRMTQRARDRGGW